MTHKGNSNDLRFGKFRLDANAWHLFGEDGQRISGIGVIPVKILKHIIESAPNLVRGTDESIKNILSYYGDADEERLLKAFMQYVSTLRRAMGTDEFNTLFPNTSRAHDVEMAVGGYTFVGEVIQPPWPTDSQKPDSRSAIQTRTGHTASTHVLVKDVDIAESEVSGVTVQVKPDPVLDAELSERTYFKYRDERVEAVHTSDTSRALAARYTCGDFACDPVSIGDQVFPVAILWRNKSEVIDPDNILRTLDFGSSTDPLASSPTLDERQYALARLFIKSEYTRGKIKHEALEYCMSSIDLTGSLPRIDGRFGRYYDNILTQYGMEWELKKALKNEGHLALARGRVGTLPLREAIEFGRNPLLNGMGRCTAMTVSMLMVFERPGQGLWTLIHKRSIDVGLSARMLHVVPAGMFEVKNPREKWSALKAVKREMLEEVYNEEEQQGGEAGFEDSLDHKKPLPFLCQLIDEKKTELSLTGICCDLLNLRPEICTVLYVPVSGLTEERDMHVNWEYEKPGPCDNFGTPWDLIEVDMQKVRVGEMVPSGVACFELGRTWLRERHGV